MCFNVVFGIVHTVLRVRLTFYGLLNAENVRVELMSEANSAAPSRVRSLAEVKVPDLEGEVRPSDSISQINAPQRRPPSEYHPPSRRETHASRARMRNERRWRSAGPCALSPATCSGLR